MTQDDKAPQPETPPPSSAPDPGAPHFVPDYGLRLSGALRTIIENKPATGLTLGYIIDEAGERAFGVLMAFLCLPFLIPLIPGVSTPFGLALMLLGAQLAVGWHRPWLPERLRRWRLPDKLTTSILSGVAKLFKPLERIIRPRLKFMQNRAAYVVVGAGLVIQGAILALPIPVPGANTVPAWMALILILGITEEDGITMLVGLILTAASVAAVIIGFSWGMEWWNQRNNKLAPTTAVAPETAPATATAPASAPSTLPATAPFPASAPFTIPASMPAQ